MYKAVLPFNSLLPNIIQNRMTEFNLYHFYKIHRLSIQQANLPSVQVYLWGISWGPSTMFNVHCDEAMHILGIWLHCQSLECSLSIFCLNARKQRHDSQMGIDQDYVQIPQICIILHDQLECGLNKTKW